MSMRLSWYRSRSTHVLSSDGDSHARASSRLTMEAMVGDLQCPVCLELFTTPIILPCSHVLCRTPCAQRLFEDHEVVRCPVCRERSLISGGLECLPRVISLENIIERYQQQAQQAEPEAPQEQEDTVEECGPDDIPCQLCDSEPAVRAAKSCLDCNASYCQRCLKVSHPSKEPFTDHQLVQPRRYPKPREQRCPLHDMKVNIYCKTCQSLGCLLCADDPSSHQNHQVLSLSQAVSVIRAEVEQNLKSVESSIEVRAEAIKTQHSHFQQFRQEVKDRVDEINEQFDSLISELETKREFFLSDVEYEEKCKQDSHEKLQCQHETHTTNLHNLVHYARQVLKETDECCFLQLAKNVNEKMVKSLALPCDVVSAPPLCSLNHKVVDLRKEKALVKDIQYLSVPTIPSIDVKKCSRSTRSVVIVLCPPAMEDVIDGYLVFYSSEALKSQGKQETMEFKAPQEERKVGSRAQPAVCLIHSDLQADTLYYFSVRAYNRSGKSETSEMVNCRTLGASQTTIPVPEIQEEQCRMYTHSIQVYSSSPTECPQDDSVCHYLLYREAAADQIWKSVSMFGRCDHRVFGLESDTRYDFVVMACDKTGECQVSNKVLLKTECAAY